MNTKLTLKLNNQVIKKAKIYAKKQRTSISKLVESHLSSILTKEKRDIEITPFVASISGVFTLPENYDYKKDYKNKLLRKYK